MSEELISVICTVKNGDKTITQTIDSVINQSHVNWEFIIVDDGSNDSTKSILEKFAVQNNRINPVYTNGIGRGNALNLAVQKATGEYIANIDADDLMHPMRLRLQFEKFIENKDAFLVSSGSVIIYGNDTVDWEDEGTLDAEKITDNLLIKNRIKHSSVMFNKQALIELGCYNQTLKSQFDYELWLRALAKEKLLLKIPNKLIAIRVHDNQSFENKNRVRYLLRSQKLQLNYAFIMKRKVLLVILITPFRVALGLLPFKLRKKVNFFISKLV